MAAAPSAVCQPLLSVYRAAHKAVVSQSTHLPQHGFPWGCDGLGQGNWDGHSPVRLSYEVVRQADRLLYPALSTAASALC